MTVCLLRTPVCLLSTPVRLFVLSFVESYLIIKPDTGAFLHYLSICVSCTAVVLFVPWFVLEATINKMVQQSIKRMYSSLVQVMSHLCCNVFYSCCFSLE